MQFKGFKKIRPKLFQKVKFDPESAETMFLVLLCAAVFGAFYFSGVMFLHNYNQKKKQAAADGKSETRILKNVFAAGNDKFENIAGAEENNLPEEMKVSEVMSGASDSVKNLAIKKARAEAAAKKLAAEKALRRSGRTLSGETEKLPDGRRICTGNSDHPERGGATHMDEDCCADYNETPNPRCYYSPEKMGIMK